MEPSVTIQYPVFKSNQILTSTQLNNLVTYFDNEARLSHTQLTGVGILYGFTYQVLSAVVSIHGGYGITTEGYLIGFEDMLNYTKAKVLTDSNANKVKELEHLKTYFTDAGLSLTGIVELFSTEPDPAEINDVTDWSTVAATLDLSTKALMVFWDIDDQDLKSCKGTNCDNKGQTRIFDLRVFIVDKANPYNLLLMPVPALRRLNDEQPLTKINNIQQIAVAYNKIVKETIPQLDAAVQAFFNRYVGLFNLSPTESMEIARVLSGTSFVDSQTPQYAYDFVRDCILCYEEMVSAAVAIEQTSGHPPFTPFKQHLFLGAITLDFNPYTHDPYRHYFIQKPIPEEGLIKVKSLFHKLWLMLHNFNTPQYDLSKKIIPDLRITPSKADPSPLSQRAIPFYYYKDDVQFKEFVFHWNRDSNRLGREFTQLSYHSAKYSVNTSVKSPLKYDITEYPFFRIEGLQGLILSDALNVIEDLKLRCDLPFEVAAIELLNPQDYDLKVPKNANSKWLHEKLHKKQKQSADYFKGPYNHQLIHKIIGENGGLFLVSDRLNSACGYGDLDVMYRLAQTSLMMKLKETKTQLQNNELIATLVQLKYLDIDAIIDDNSGTFDYLAEHLNDHLHELIDGFPNWMATYKAMLDYLIRIKLTARQYIEEVIDNPPPQDKLLRKFEWLSFTDNAIDGMLYDANYLQINNLYHTILWRIDYYARHDQTIFHNFVRKYTGLEHQAGVPKGGTFVMVYETNPSDQSRRVVADFALPYACTCEGCEIPIGNPAIPPIARPDYIIIQQVKIVQNEAVTLQANATIQVLSNDYDATQLGHFQINFGEIFEGPIENIAIPASIKKPVSKPRPITFITTQKGGTAKVIKTKEGLAIEYKNEVSTGFDTFEYNLINVETGSQDTAMVTVLVLPTLIFEAVDDTVDLYGKPQSEFFIPVKVLENNHLLNINKKKMTLQAITGFPMNSDAAQPVQLMPAIGDQDPYFQFSPNLLNFDHPSGAFKYRIGYKNLSAEAFVNVAYKLLTKNFSVQLSQNMPLIIDVLAQSIVPDKEAVELTLLEFDNGVTKELKVIETIDGRLEVILNKQNKPMLQFTPKKPFISLFGKLFLAMFSVKIPSLGKSDSSHVTIENETVRVPTQRTVTIGSIIMPSVQNNILLSDIDPTLQLQNVNLQNSATEFGGFATGPTKVTGKAVVLYNTPAISSNARMDSFVLRNDSGDVFEDITVKIPLKKAPQKVDVVVNLGRIFKTGIANSIPLTEINTIGKLQLVPSSISFWDKSLPTQSDLGGALTFGISGRVLPPTGTYTYTSPLAIPKGVNADRYWIVDSSGVIIKTIEIIIPFNTEGLKDQGSNAM